MSPSDGVMACDGHGYCLGLKTSKPSVESMRTAMLRVSAMQQKANRNSPRVGQGELNVQYLFCEFL